GTFSGTGVTGNLFLPSVAGIGSYTVTYTYTDGNGCFNSLGRSVTVTNLPVVSFSGLAASYCAGGDPALLSGSPAGGVFSGPGVVGNTFDPGIAGVGTSTIQYMYTDGGGCADSTTQSVVVNPDSPLLSVDSVTTTDAACDSSCNGTAEVVGSGGVAPYSYLWSTGDVGATAANLCASTFTITVTDASGCQASNDIIVSNPNNLNSSIIASTMVIGCNGDCNGTAEVIGSGGLLPYTYSWVDTANTSQGVSTATIAALCADAYYAIVKDATGCISTAPLTITEPGVLTAAFCGQQNVSCNGVCDGSATACLTGGTGPFTYLWDDPGAQTTATATGLCAGTLFRVDVTDSQGCTAAATLLIITQPSAVVATISGTTNANCDTLTPVGSATVVGAGGVGPYLYAWNTAPPQTDSVADGQYAGLYNVTVTDQNGCVDTTSATISDTSNMSASITALTLSSCGGACDGSATVTAVGSVTPYTYDWVDDLAVSIGQTTALASSLCAGDYRAIVTSNVQCIKSVPVNTQPPLPVVNFTGLSTSVCISGTVETLIGSPVGGVFSGSGVSGSTFDPAAAGPGTHPVKYVYDDGFGCKDSSTQTVSVNSLPVVSYSGLNSDYCLDASPAVLFGTPVGGIFSGAGITATVFTPATAGAGIHSITYTFTDGNGCADSSLTSVIVNALPTPSIGNLDPMHCIDGVGAVLTGTPSGGIFSGNGISGITFFPAFAGLGAHTVSYVYTDGNTCSNTVGQLTNVVALPVVSFSGLSVTYCASNLPAPLTGSPTGGTFSGPGAVSNTFDPSIAGIGTHTIQYLFTDGNGCSDSSSQTVVVNTASPFLSVDSVSTTEAACDSTCNATAEVIGSGGVAPYSYLWSNGDVGTVASALCASTFFVTVTDANGCMANNDIIVAGPNGFTSSIIDTTMVVGCTGACNGTALVVGNGGVPPYTYSWVDTAGNSLGISTSAITALCANAYYGIVKDASNCVTTAPFTITEPGALTASACGIQDVSCNSLCDGSATGCLTGGTGPFTYLWDDPGAQTTATATGLCAGTFRVDITDSQGCTAFDAAVIVTEPSVVVATISGTTNANCDTLSPIGSATVNGSGGIGPYLYAWDTGPPQTDFVADGQYAGTYNVTITDQNGCEATTVATIT
ncbi:MAG: SprB repeat-containing protein, partial [Flavobacteriales bacterium]|nr:SprB repeat-containing protein [Flavobacteriales bacterium]